MVGWEVGGQAEWTGKGKSSHKPQGGQKVIQSHASSMALSISATGIEPVTLRYPRLIEINR